MKRKLALLLVVLLVVTVAFAACKNPEKTTADARWGTEKHVFRVTLADTRVTSSNTVSFKAYDEKGAELDNGTNTSYRKDKAIAGENLSTKDEVMPVAVDGTYTLTIEPTDAMGKCVVTGEQVLYLQYMKQSTVQGETVDLTQWAELNQVTALETEVANTTLTPADDKVILKSYTKTVVEFDNQTQQPISSSTTVKGFYLGKVHRQVTNYKVSTTYNFDEKEQKKPTATVTVDGEEPVTRELAKNFSVKVIDANQILMYVRSLSKTEGSLQDSHSVNVFDPFTGTTQSASFSYTYQDRIILTNRGVDPEQKLFTTVNSVAVTIGGNAFMLQDNVPQTVGEVDQANVSTVTRARLTTLHFRVGYLSYEIEYSNTENTANWTGIWEALTPKAEENAEGD